MSHFPVECADCKRISGAHMLTINVSAQCVIVSECVATICAGMPDLWIHIPPTLIDS